MHFCGKNTLWLILLRHLRLRQIVALYLHSINLDDLIDEELPVVAVLGVLLGLTFQVGIQDHLLYLWWFDTFYLQ